MFTVAEERKGRNVMRLVCWYVGVGGCVKYVSEWVSFSQDVNSERSVTWSELLDVVGEVS